VAVQVLAGSVVAHGGTRVGVTGGDLDVPQIHAGIETGRDVRYLYSILRIARSWLVFVGESRG
jgi:hypothetical protein